MSLSNLSATGNIGRDVETRQAGSSTVATFPLAVTVGFGERQSTMWVRCNLWGNRATGGLIQYLVKGQAVAVSGELSEPPYTTKEGEPRKSLELNVNSLDLIGSKKEAAAPAQAPAKAGPSIDDGYTDDDIPF